MEDSTQCTLNFIYRARLENIRYPRLGNVESLPFRSFRRNTAVARFC